MERQDPSRATPKIDSEAPKRVKLRNDKDDPMFT
jgi:hypothetical protein